MRSRSLVLAAVAASVFASADLARAAFTLSFLPSAQAAPAGKFAYDFFAQNDAGGTDGSNLQAVKINLTAGGSTRVFFNTVDLANGTTPETYSSDQYNFGAGTSGTNVTDLGSSNLRIGTRTAGQHAFPNYPGDDDSPISQDGATNGLSSFTADYAVLSAAVSVPTPTAPGARFARLVFNTSTPQINMVISLAGETGAGVDYTFGVTPSNSAPVPVGPVAPTPVVFGTVVSNGANFSVSVTVTDADAADVLALTLGSLPAGITNTQVTGGGTTPQVFTITGNVNYSLNKSTVVIPFTVTDGVGGHTIPGSFSLIVTPEPASLAVLGGAAIMGIVRRRR
jgi:hypothetical protein